MVGLATAAGILVRVQDEDHPEQFAEGLVIQLCVVQPFVLVRRLDRGQLADAGAVEAPRVLARAARPAGGRPGPGHPQGRVAAQLAHQLQAPCVQPLDHRLAGVVAVPHEDVDVGPVLHGQGLVEQGRHGPHLGPRRPGAARLPAGTGRRRGLQAAVDGIRTVLLQVQDRQELALLAPGHPALPVVPAPADPRQLAPALGDEGAVAGPGQVVRVRNHRAQAGQVERRKVAGPGRLPAVRVGAAGAEAGQVAVGGAARQAGQLRQQVGEVGPLRFAEGQVGQYSGQQGHGTPPGWRGGSTHTITGAVLPPLLAGGRRFRKRPSPGKNMAINPRAARGIPYLKNCSPHWKNEMCQKSFLIKASIRQPQILSHGENQVSQQLKHITHVF